MISIDIKRDKNIKDKYDHTKTKFVTCEHGKLTFYVNSDEMKLIKKTLLFTDVSKEKDGIVLRIMMGLPRNSEFVVTCVDNKSELHMNFIEDKVYCLDDGSFRRKVRIIRRRATLQQIEIANDLINRSPRRRNKDRMIYKGSKRVNKDTEFEYSYEYFEDSLGYDNDYESRYMSASSIEHTDILHGSSNLSNYRKYSRNDNRISHTNKKNKDAFVLLEENNIAQNIQLIKSSRNHVTMHHDVRNVNAKMIVYDKTIKAFRRMNMAVHYCNKCHKYFDYYESFTHQLSQNNIPITNILINYFDDNDEYIQFDTYNLKEHSRLSLLGYSVGQSGLPRFKRQFLIDKIIDKKLMTASQIKNHLEFLIHFHGRKSNMKNAVSSWEEDIDYINRCIMNGKY